MSQSVAIRLKDNGEKPSDVEVEILFSRVLLALLLPDNEWYQVCEQLEENETIDGKWRMVQMNAALLNSSAVSTLFGADDAALLVSLTAPGAALLGPLGEVRTRLSTSSRGWLEGFYANRGLETLVTILDGCAAAEAYSEFEGYAVLQCFQCVKAVFNHRAGLDRACSSQSTNGLLEALARAALKEPATLVGAAVATLGLQLLGVAAHYTKQGVAILEMDDLVFAGMGTRDKPVPASVSAAALTLANALINDQDDVRDRCALRAQLRPMFDDDKRCVEGAVDRAAKKLETRALGEGEGDLVAVKSSSGAKVLGAFGASRTKQRVYTLRDAKLSWARESTGVPSSSSSTSTTNLGDTSPTKGVRRPSEGVRRPSTRPQTTTAAATMSTTSTMAAAAAPHTTRPSFLGGGHAAGSRRSSKGGGGGDEDHAIDLTPEVAVVSLGRSADNVEGFVFEVQAPNRTLELTAATARDRTVWVEAIRRATSRVELAHALVTADHGPIPTTTTNGGGAGAHAPHHHHHHDYEADGSLWEVVMKPFDAVVDDASAGGHAEAVIKAQKLAFGTIAESDRFQSLAELGVDLNDLGSVLRKLKDEAFLRRKTRDVIDVAAKLLTALAAGEPLPPPPASIKTDAGADYAARLLAALAAGEPLPRAPSVAPTRGGSPGSPSSMKFLTPVLSLLEKKNNNNNNDDGSQQQLRVKAPPPPKRPPPAGLMASIVEQHSSEDNDEQPLDPKFEKMLKNGVPRTAVEIRMRAEGFDPARLPHHSATPAPAAPPAAASPSGNGGNNNNNPEVAKYLKMLKFGLPRAAVEQKMRAEGMDPALLGGGSEAPPPPPPSGDAASPVAQGPFGEEPRVAMRALYWAPLRGPKAGSLWKDVAADDIELDLMALEASFRKEQQSSAKAPATVKFAMGSSARGHHHEAEAPGFATVKPSFVDAKTLQNVGIVLAKLKKQVPDIAWSVLRGDVALIDGQRASLLLGACPPSDLLVRAEELGPDGCVNPVERFFFECSKVPDYAARVDALRLHASANEHLLELRGSLEAVHAAASMAVADPTLRAALRAALQVGNYVNGGTTRGLADGFRLEGLRSFAVTKGADGTAYADHVAAAVVARRGEDAAAEELEGLKRALDAAASVHLAEWDKEWATLSTSLAAVERVVRDDAAAVDNDDRQTFAFTFAPFVGATRDILKALKRLRAEVQEALTQVSQAFDGPSASGFDGGELFGEHLGGFVKSLIKGIQNNRARLEAAERAKMAYKPPKRKSNVGAGGDPDDLFKAFAQVQLDEESVVQAFNKRHETNMTRFVEL